MHNCQECLILHKKNLSFNAKVVSQDSFPLGVCVIVITIFLGQFRSRGKGTMRLDYVKHQPVRQGLTTTLGTRCPSLFDRCVGSLTSPA